MDVVITAGPGPPREAPPRPERSMITPNIIACPCGGGAPAMNWNLTEVPGSRRNVDGGSVVTYGWKCRSCDRVHQ